MKGKTNGSAQRKLVSWIDHFVEVTSALESPELFRKWTAIATIGAVLEQKVFLMTTSPMYPNLYTFLVAPPGGGKSRSIDLARDLISALPDPYIAPTSVNAASIIDHIKECKRVIMDLPNPPIEYNSMSILVGEFGTFMSQYDDDLMAILTDFYNVRPYSQRRRGNQLHIPLDRPQLNMLIGTTPANLMKFMPDVAWGQGFASRIMFIYADTKELVDDFAPRPKVMHADLTHDLNIINTLVGQFLVSDAYRNDVNSWREADENIPPKPTHPRLVHYNSRRKEHLYRLSMVSAIDRGTTLILDHEDFLRAMAWLIEAEQFMPKIFDAGGTGDSQVMDEAYHLVKKNGRMGEGQLIRYVRQRVPAHAVTKIIELMVQSGMLVELSKSRLGLRDFKAGDIGQ